LILEKEGRIKIEGRTTTPTSSFVIYPINNSPENATNLLSTSPSPSTTSPSPNMAIMQNSASPTTTTTTTESASTTPSTTNSIFLSNTNSGFVSPQNTATRNQKNQKRQLKDDEEFVPQRKIARYEEDLGSVSEDNQELRKSKKISLSSDSRKKNCHVMVYRKRKRVANGNQYIHKTREAQVLLLFLQRDLQKQPQLLLRLFKNAK